MSARIRRLGQSLLVLLCTAACESGSDEGGSNPCDGGPPTWDVRCETPFRAVSEFVQANNTCTQDSDCLWVDGFGLPTVSGHCSGGAYLRVGYDPVEWAQRVSLFETCTPEFPNLCSAVHHPPACWRGRCVSSGGVQGFVAQKDSCAPSGTGETACSTCVCSFDHPPVIDCLARPECRAMFECAVQAGCLGTATCDLDACDGPCTSQAEKLHPADVYASIQESAKRSGCFLSCEKSP